VTSGVIQLHPSDAFAKALLAAPNGNSRVIAFVGNTAYRLHTWTLIDDTLLTEWVSEAESIKASTLPLEWRLKWRVRKLWFRVRP
jgi:hypothetical protein